jgi:hypothetical protein
MTYEREDLEQLGVRYLDALIARDPSKLPLHSEFRLTENGQELMLGDGLWGTANGTVGYQHIVVDRATGGIAMTAVLHENDRPVIVGIRLALRDDRIAEAETVVSRTDILFYKDGAQKLAAMREPAPLWREVLPEQDRMSREDLAALADSYFRTLERNDGSFIAPFEDGCRRLDNGVYATQAPEFDKEGSPPFYGLGPAEQFALGYFGFVTEVRDRRFPVIDTERGIVASLPFLDHAGTIHEVRLTDGRTVPINVRQPYSWQIFEFFKLRLGKIAQIEVVLNMVPYRMKSGW